jgi:hypothetical protein
VVEGGKWKVGRGNAPRKAEFGLAKPCEKALDVSIILLGTIATNILRIYSFGD